MSDGYEPMKAILAPAAMERVRGFAEQNGVELVGRPRRWRLRAYYAEGVTRRRLVAGKRVGPAVEVGGRLAFELWGKSAEVLEPDRLVAEERPDIGRVELLEPCP